MAGSPIAAAVHSSVLQRAHVVDRVGERQRHHVGVARDERRGPRGPCRSWPARRRSLSGRLMPLSACELGAARRRVCDRADAERSGSVALDDPADPAVVDPDTLAWPARPRRPAADVQPMVAGLSTRPTRSHAAGRPGARSRVRMSRSPLASAIARLGGRDRADACVADVVAVALDPQRAYPR